jgi:rubrerythrin
MKEMISKEDVKNYLDKMIQIENRMEKTYEQLAKEVNSDDIKKTLENLVSDEKGHALEVETLQTLLNNWE